MRAKRLLFRTARIRGIGIVLAFIPTVVISTLRLFPTREERRHILGMLRAVQGPVQACKSCVAARICEEDGSDEAILYMEQWESESEFRQHVSSELFRRILLALEASRKEPEVQFHFVSVSKGMELIEALRTTSEDL